MINEDKRQAEEVAALDKVRRTHLVMQEAGRLKDEASKARVEALRVLASVEKRADDAYIDYSQAYDVWCKAKKELDAITLEKEN